MTNVPQPAESSPKINIPASVLKQGKQVAAKLRILINTYPNVYACEVEGKPYPKVEAYQFVAACYQHTPRITSTREVGQDQGFVATAHLLNHDGLVVSGAEAECLRAEPDWASKPTFQLQSMAQTRAGAKAYRNLFAWIMPLAGLSPTPAEEMIGAQSDAPVSRKRSKEMSRVCSNCPNKISAKMYQQTIKSHNRPLCLECRSKVEPQFPNKVNEPSQVPSAVTSIQEGRKQPVTELLDAMPKDEKAYSI